MRHVTLRISPYNKILIQSHHYLLTVEFPWFHSRTHTITCLTNIWSFQSFPGWSVKQRFTLTAEAPHSVMFASNTNSSTWPGSIIRISIKLGCIITTVCMIIALTLFTRICIEYGASCKLLVMIQWLTLLALKAIQIEIEIIYLLVI